VGEGENQVVEIIAAALDGMMVLFYPDGSLTFSLLAIADLRSERIGKSLAVPPILAHPG